MANIFVPFDLKIRDMGSSTVTVEWDLDNTVEFKAGTYYKVYTSDDGLSYSFLANANVKYTSIPLRNNTFYVKVSSVVVGLGESAPSLPLTVSAQTGTVDFGDQTTIAVTPTGEPIKLRATPNGELLVSAASFSLSGVTITGFSTEAKQDLQISAAATLLAQVSAFKLANHTDLDAVANRLVLFQAEAHSDSINILNKLDAFKTQNNLDILATKLEVANFKVANHNDLDALKTEVTGLKTANHTDIGVVGMKVDAVGTAVGTVKTAVDNFASTNNTNLGSANTKLEEIKTKLQEIKLEVIDSNLSRLLRAETTLSNVTTAGITVTLPWKARSIIHQITLVKESGAATKWSIEVINKNFPITERNIICRMPSYEVYDPNRTDLLKTIPYINIDNADEVRVRVIPDAGTSNQFALIVSGEQAK